jgi:alkanesulfonate monooxygenase SsuD/methylene tetrahydromethanopterin reductase-like flavin-dependent oxidoreductase (luciferase family)
VRPGVGTPCLAAVSERVARGSAYRRYVRVDVLLDTFGARWDEIAAGTEAAERAGLDGVWINDHLAGAVHAATHVLECWTVLSAIAASVPRVALGPLVLNVANRDPAVVAVMAATLQEVSGGRLHLGLGAGGGPGTTYAAEQELLGRPVAPDRERRSAVASAIAVLHKVWSDTGEPATGFLRPEPAPPVIVAGNGPKMAALAGRAGDGFCAPLGPRFADLVAAARAARAAAGRDPETLIVIGSTGSVPRDRDMVVGLALDRLIIAVDRPYGDVIARIRDEMRA